MPGRSCPHCNVGSNWKLQTTMGECVSANDLQVSIWKCEVCDKCIVMEGAPNDYTKSDVLYPQGREESPQDYPAEVKDNYAEAVRSLNGANYKACVMMTR